MRTLAIDCATEACSVALLQDGVVLASETRVLGRGHAEHLVPMIAALPDRGKAGRILASLGPGSFTGVRIGIATARALAIAWQAEVAGYPTMALVAAMALDSRRSDAVTVCMTGGHGEWFVQDFGTGGLALSELVSVPPAAAAARGARALVAGNQAAALAALVETPTDVIETLPDAAFSGALPASVLRQSLSPIYGRAPDARLPA